MAKVIRLHKLLPTESDEQKIVIEYLKARGMMFAHVPNGAKRSYQTASWLKSLGMVKGIPDILIFDRVPGMKSEGVRGVAIEMKRQRGGVLSLEQKEAINRLEQCGWICCVAKGADDAMGFINKLWP